MTVVETYFIELQDRKFGHHLSCHLARFNVSRFFMVNKMNLQMTLVKGEFIVCQPGVTE
jgi:hypothetical protein